MLERDKRLSSEQLDKLDKQFKSKTGSDCEN